MSCDIHACIEIQNKNGTWSSIGLALETNEKGEFVTDYGVDEKIVKESSYHFFSILAGVRNGYGFGGSPTGLGFVPISMARGIPEDASPLYLKLVERWAPDGHNHSWHTLKQILDFNWQQKTRCCGVVDSSNFAKWIDSGGLEPEKYYDSVSGPGVRHVTQFEMMDLIRRKENTSHTYTVVDWAVEYQKVAERFLNITVRYMLDLALHHGLTHHQVRFVFFFDN